MDELAWTDVALQDLDDIASYIALDSPLSAEKVVRRIVETVAALAYHPKMVVLAGMGQLENWS